MDHFFNTQEIGPFDYPPPPPPPQQQQNPPPPPINDTQGRAKIYYTHNQKMLHDAEKFHYSAEYDILTETNPIYEEQRNVAKQVIDWFKLFTSLFILIVAPTQSGKTGINCDLLYRFVKYEGVPVDNLFYCIAKSDISLKDQTKMRLPKMIRDHVYHLPDFNKQFVKDIKDKTNCVIILDECGYACREYNSFMKALKEANLVDKDELYRRNIRIVLVSATPDGIMHDIQKWGEGVYKIIRGIPGPNYTSCTDLYALGRVKDSKCLFIHKNFLEIHGRIIDYETNGNRLYHIFRSYYGEKHQKFKKQFTDHFGDTVDYHDYIQTKQKEDINILLSEEPKKQTIIFIKEKIRCGNTLVKTYLGIIHERFSTNDSVIIQGLIGRGTGYDVNSLTVIYTNTQSIINYSPIENGYFGSDYTSWSSSSTEVRGNAIRGKNTFMNPVHYKGSGVLPDRRREPKPEAFYIILTSFVELQECYKEFHVQEYGANHGKRGPQQIKKNADGFYEGTIRQNSHRVLSYDQVLHEKNNAISDKKPCAHKPCYTNVFDPNTLQFVFIHRNPEFSFSVTGVL